MYSREKINDGLLSKHYVSDCYSLSFIQYPRIFFSPSTVHTVESFCKVSINGQVICTFRVSGYLKLLFILFYVIFGRSQLWIIFQRYMQNVYYDRYNKIRPLDVVMKFLPSEVSQHIIPQGGLILLPPNSDVH